MSKVEGCAVEADSQLVLFNLDPLDDKRPICQICKNRYTPHRPDRSQTYCSSVCAGKGKSNKSMSELPVGVSADAPYFETLADRKAYTKKLLEAGCDFGQVARILKVSKSTAWKICTDKEEQPTSRRKRLYDLPVYKIEGAADRIEPIVSGTATELIVKAKLLTLGFDVWAPVMDRHRSDLAVLVGARLIRIQTKTAGFDQKSQRYRAGLFSKRKGIFVRYDDSEFEFFIVKCAGIEEYYVIPSSVGNKVGYVNLYPHREALMGRRSTYEQYRNQFDVFRK